MWLVALAPNAGALDANDVRAGPQVTLLGAWLFSHAACSRYVYDLDVNYVAEMLDKLQDGCPTLRDEIGICEVFCCVQVFIKKQSYVTHEHFNSELKRLRGTMATLGDSRQVLPFFRNGFVVSDASR